MSVALDFQKVDILFARERGRRGAALTKAALEALDRGENRAAVAAAGGVIVGVSNASLSVERGHISVLMGLSGSGKSTLLRAANGLNRVTRGRVLVDDGGTTIDVASCDTATLRRLRRSRVTMMFQQFGLLPWRSVRANVGLGLELRGEPTATRTRVVDEKLALVGLSDWADHYVSELSGGMQQRVGLARAFATDADILLMDEPFSALDPLIRTRLQDELCALQQRVKKTILFVTHDLDEALKLGDQISVLEGGRIVQTGTPEDIVLRPANAYVAEFVQHMNPLAVLDGAMVMSACAALERAGDGLWLDADRGYQLLLGSGAAPRQVLYRGEPLPLFTAGNPEAAITGAGLAIAAVDVPLRWLIRLQRHTGHPVLLAGSAGEICGVCGPLEVIRALSGGHGAPEQADGAN